MVHGSRGPRGRRPPHPPVDSGLGGGDPRPFQIKRWNSKLRTPKITFREKTNEERKCRITVRKAPQIEQISKTNTALTKRAQYKGLPHQKKQANLFTQKMVVATSISAALPHDHAIYFDGLFNPGGNGRAFASNWGEAAALSETMENWV